MNYEKANSHDRHQVKPASQSSIWILFPKHYDLPASKVNSIIPHFCNNHFYENAIFLCFLVHKKYMFIGWVYT